MMEQTFNEAICILSLSSHLQLALYNAGKFLPSGIKSC